MALDKKAKDHLEGLIKMSKENYSEMSSRWDELDQKSELSFKDSDVFRMGYAFGKIEHKFIDWFYSEYGRSQTDDEYMEFWNTVKKI